MISAKFLTHPVAVASFSKIKYLDYICVKFNFKTHVFDLRDKCLVASRKTSKLLATRDTDIIRVKIYCNQFCQAL